MAIPATKDSKTLYESIQALMPKSFLFRVVRWLPWADCVLKELLDRKIRRLGRRRNPKNLPVFIVGSGRCGTTLLGVILDSHPNIAITPETQFLPGVVYRLLRVRGVQNMVEVFFSFPRVSETGVTRDELASIFRKQRLKTPSALLESFYTNYAERRGKIRWGDNTPAYTGCMGLIERLFGGAAFIHMIRDGRDVAVSMMPLDWGPNTVAEAAHYWKAVVLKTRQVGAKLHHYYEIRYEDLLNAPETTLRNICNFLNEPFSPSMLDYKEAGRARLNQMKLDTGTMSVDARKQSQVRITSGFDTSRIGRWENVFSEDERREFFEIAGDLLQEMGYDEAP